MSIDLYSKSPHGKIFLMQTTKAQICYESTQAEQYPRLVASRVYYYLLVAHCIYSDTAFSLNIFIYLNIVQYLQLQHLYVYEDLDGSYK